MDVNARNTSGNNAAHVAAMYDQPRVLEVLCAAGAHLRTRDATFRTPMEDALHQTQQGNDLCARVLVAYGMRLSTVSEDFRHCITPELVAFERGVLCCRAAVVAMLRVKRAGKLWMWEKFLLLEMAVCIWSTRYDKGWQTAAQQQHK